MLGHARRARGAQQRTQAAVMPAPSGGMDARVGVASERLDVCILAYNLVPSEYGLKIRSGYREWRINHTAEVRTVIPYTGNAQDGTQDRLFAVTPEGIYDATTPGDTPILMLGFPNIGVNEDAGHGVYTSYVNGAGDNLLFYADGAHGLHQYSPDTDTWEVATGIVENPTATAPIDLTKVVFVMCHKLRMWLVEKESNKAWYLPILSTTGEATEFFFGSKFQRGGYLVGLFSWTVDGGRGRDDHLVAIGQGGDVIPFTGDDPSSSVGSNGWQNTGTFYIGEIPRGRRVASEYGGDLFLLSTFGIISMRDLVSGAAVETESAGGIGLKIARLLRQDLVQNADAYGWDIEIVPHEGSMIVSTPVRSDGRYLQYAFSLSTKGWGIWRDIPALSSTSWQGALMIGTADGRVLRMDVGRDEELLSGDDSKPIEWSILSSYTALGAPATYKRVSFIRPNWNARVAPTYNAYAYYDYEVIEPVLPGGGVSDATVSVWDTALWDNGTWATDQGEPNYRLQGTEGMGRMVAIAMVGTGQDEATLAGWDIMWNPGGLL